MTTAAVLLEALADYLRHEVQPGTDGAAAYKARIAINLLQMLAREEALGPQLRALDADAASALALDPVEPLPDLARALRDGRVFDECALLEFLRRRAILQLDIDNPRYASLADARARWAEGSAEQQED